LFDLHDEFSLRLIQDVANDVVFNIVFVIMQKIKMFLSVRAALIIINNIIRATLSYSLFRRSSRLLFWR